MKQEIHTELKNKLVEILGREPHPHEEINAENDALLLTKVLLKRVEIIEEKLKNNSTQ